MPLPKVTVAMSIFNGKLEWIDEAVESVLRQTLGNFEFLIVDDGSTDPVIIEHLSQLEKIDSRIRLFRQPHKGLAASLNFILKHAKGEYFARMDSDDISLPTRFEHQVKFLEHHPEVVAVSTWYDLIDEKGKQIKTVSLKLNHDEIVREMMLKNNPFPHPPVMMRTSTLWELGGYSEDFGYNEDYELWTRMVDVGRLAIIPKVLYQVRLSRSSVSHTNVEENYRTFWLVWKTWELRRRGVPDAYEQALAELNKRWKFYKRYFKAEGLRVQASRERLLGNKKEARSLLALAWRATPWNPIYPLLWILTFFR